MDGRHFLVRRDRLSEHKLVTRGREELPPGAVELEVDRFGLSANNVTYGALGDALSYWQFFPEDEPGWGRIPVWGFGTVVRSDAVGVAPGERFYGYYPMSTHLTVQPRRVDEAGFIDGAPHRRALSGAYNQYRRTASDPNYRADTEAQQVILRPLFAASFFLADFLDDNRFFGAEGVVFSSASSKTAYGTAFLLARAPERPRLIGLTGGGHVPFVERLGLYDDVVPYPELSSLPADRPTAYVDLSGNRGLRAAVHGHFGAALVCSIAVGATDWQALGGLEGLPGPPPVPFFTPTRVKQRSEQWTPAGLQRRLAEAWGAFLVPILDPSRDWLHIVHGRGGDAVGRAFDDVVAGRVDARDGHVLSL